MATSGNTSFESTKIDSRRTPSTTVGGCLDGRRPPRGRQKKTCHRSARQNREAAKTSRIDSLRFLVCTMADDPCNIQIIQQCASCRCMWEQQSWASPRIWAGPGCIHPLARSSPHPCAGLRWSFSRPCTQRGPAKCPLAEEAWPARKISLQRCAQTGHKPGVHGYLREV